LGAPDDVGHLLQDIRFRAVATHWAACCPFPFRSDFHVSPVPPMSANHTLGRRTAFPLCFNGRLANFVRVLTAVGLRDGF
jgi:hypothetical protein